MKISKDSHIYINCRTKQEQDMMFDIFEHAGLTWEIGDLAKYRVVCTPMRFLIENQYLYQGYDCVEGRYLRHIPAIEAKDLRNQWISIKKGLDK